MASSGPVCRSAIVQEKLFSCTALEPSDADLNLIGERDEDVVVDSDNEPLKKSKAKVADSGDEPISNLKGKGKANAKKVQKSKFKSRLRRHQVDDDDDDDDIDSDYESDEDDDMSDEDEEEKDARLALKRRLGKRKAILDSDEIDTPEEQKVIFGHKKTIPVSEEAIRLMPKLLASTKMKVCLAALIFNTWLSPLAAYDGSRSSVW